MDITTGSTRIDTTAKGAWTLISPDGKKFVDDSPLHVCRQELESRVPVKVRLERIEEALYGLCQLCEDDIDGDNPLYLAKGTPAEIGPLCLCCFNTIIDDVEGKRASEVIRGHGL